MIKGVSGEIDFGISGNGLNAKLKAASPGTFFVLAGAAIIIWGLTVEKPIAIGSAVQQNPVAEQARANNDNVRLIDEPIP